MNIMKIHETLLVDILWFLFLLIFSANKKQQQVERAVFCSIFVVGWFRGPQHVGWCCCGKFPKVPWHDRKRSPGRERKKESWKTAIRWVQAVYINLKKLTNHHHFPKVTNLKGWSFSCLSWNKPYDFFPFQTPPDKCHTDDVIGHFRIASCLCIKTRHDARTIHLKMSFDNRINFMQIKPL